MSIEQCLKLQEKAKKYIPGMAQLLSKRPDMFSAGIWPGYFSKASGAKVWDLDGNEYLDMSISGIGANVLGYADPDVDSAVIKAIENGTSCSLNCPEEVELAERLCDLHPWAQMVRYARTGGEAMAIAVRIARAKTERDVIAFCGYHGWHDWYLAANVGHESALDGHLIAGLAPRGVPKCLAGTAFPFSYNNLNELEKIVNDHKSNLAAIVMEPIRNFEPEKGFLEGVIHISKQTNTVLIIDEISAGFRLTNGGAHLKYLPEPPDIAVFSKSLGNGYPIAAVIGNTSTMQAAQETFISSTYWTERIGPTAALATIAKFQKANVADHLTRLGELVTTGWKELAVKHGLKIQITGAMKAIAHFSFLSEYHTQMKAFFIQKMLEKGFLASTLYYAMYVHTEMHINRYLEAVDQAFYDLANTLQTGNLSSKLHGKPSAMGFQRIA